MTRLNLLRRVATAGLTALAVGCAADGSWDVPPTPTIAPPQGYASDPIWELQERNGEASDFVVYDHEFVGETFRLNKAGEDHVKQIAFRLRQGAPFPVVVEQAYNSVRPGAGEHQYPVYNNPELDLQRRELIVRALAAMGIDDAQQRVVVGPALADGFEAVEAERAYARGLTNETLFGTGFGGGFGGGRNFGFGRF
jgi:hypothetical protein